MKREIQICTRILRSGGTLLYPTDTVWGIGCDATNAAAVQKVRRIKQRAGQRAMLVLVDSIEMLSAYVEEVPEIAYEILKVSDSPLTIVYPRARGFAENLPDADGSIGIRITSEPFSRALVHEFSKPIVSSSANLAGQSPPANFAGISREIIAEVDHVANWGRDERYKNKPSGILKVHLNGQVEILRR